MAKYKHLTEHQKQQILRIYTETKSTRVTANRLGLKIQRVRHLLKRRGIELTGYRETVCHKNADLVIQLAQDGCSYSEIARQIGTNHHRVKEFLVRLEIPHPGHKQMGSNNPNWKGGRIIDKDGYVLIHFPTHPNADRHGYVREHRLVMEQHIGRYLSSDEVVHHIDDDSQNNVLDNLKLYPSNAAHLAETLEGKVPNWTDEGWQRILVGCRRPRDQQYKPNRD